MSQPTSLPVQHIGALTFRDRDDACILRRTATHPADVRSRPIVTADDIGPTTGAVVAKDLENTDVTPRPTGGYLRRRASGSAGSPFVPPG